MSDDTIITNAKPAVAELVGTTILALLLGLATQITYDSLYIPAAVGLVIAVLVYWFGPVSGGHFNPAVTLSMLVIGKIKPLRAFMYLVMQLLGAWLGFWLTYYFIKYYPSFESPTGSPAFWAEFTGAFIVVYTITKVITDEIAAPLGSLMIGAAFILAITIANPISGGLLNPAIAINLHIMHVSHVLGPVLGGIVAAPLALWFGGVKRAKK